MMGSIESLVGKRQIRFSIERSNKVTDLLSKNIFSQDDIHTVYYGWAMQQLSAEELEEGEIHPRWQLREMQQLGIQAII